MPINKKTKIVATLGPACDDKEIMRAMIRKGVNVFRINFSHADYEEVKKRIQKIRNLNEEYGYRTAILADLQGPKLRVGVMKENVFLNENDEFTFTTHECIGDHKKAFMTYQAFPKDVKAGEHILVDDGKLKFEVISSNNIDEVKTKVLVGGTLSSKKGVNLPNTKVSLPALTEKDKKDAIFAIEQEVDWFALSFVRTKKDLTDLHELIAKHSPVKIPIIAKIEKPEAVKNIDKIITKCDGLMVARGDLGVELPMEQVPLIQKMLVLKAKQARIPVIVATQMMETMITNQVPTRAEVNDVANSIIDGADAVMLSGETSVGAHPIKVIEQMSNIIKSVESAPIIKVPQELVYIRTKRFITKAICYHAALMSKDLGAKIITSFTNSGYTAFQISAWRPDADIIVFSSNKRIVNRLSLLWGVKAFYNDKMLEIDETIKEINKFLIDRKYVTHGDFIISLTSMPTEATGMTNTIRVSEIK
ncbi:MAG TPA: pyruvate kinase [Flavobacteriaceae bacterium]|nr:pyruvate kinase [Flavobacteriaceae bacterium]